MNYPNRIHYLFNELHRELDTLARKLPVAELGEIDPNRIVFHLDALHHDYAELSLRKEL